MEKEIVKDVIMMIEDKQTKKRFYKMRNLSIADFLIMVKYSN